MQAVISVSKAEGTCTLPPSKSMAHRAVLCAALAKGESLIENLVASKDVLASMEAVKAMGAKVAYQNGTARITGTDAFAGGAPLIVDCGESGSTMRFLVPILALSGRDVSLKGHGRLMQRPMEPYAKIFGQCSLFWRHSEDALHFTGPLSPGAYYLPGDVSSQFVTGLLLALPLLKGDSEVYISGRFESSGYVDLTRQVQEIFGVAVRWEAEHSRFFVPGRQSYKPMHYTVPADYSQAAFPAVLGAVKGGIALKGLEAHSAQPDAVIMEILGRCGAGVQVQGDTVTLQNRPLCACEKINLSNCPDLGPVLMALGLFCRGKTHIYNAARLRIKESDRIAAMEQELRKFGGQLESTEDTITINGGQILHAPSEPLQGHNDHRVVMALTVAALAAGLPARIDGAEAVAKSWPDFFRFLRELGADIQEVEQ